MAYGTNVGLDTSFAAGADLSSSQFCFVKLNTSGQAILGAGATGEAVVGVVQNDPTATQAADVRYGGITPVVCGGTFNPGDLLACDSSGHAVKYTKATVFTGTPYLVSGSDVLGVATSAGASGQQASMIFQPRGFHS